MATKNLGNVRALISGTIAPTNKSLIWEDTSVSPYVKKIWNTVSLVWEPISTGGGGGVTNLSYTASATNGIVTSDTGTDATIPAGSTTNASLMLPADKQKLDNQSGTNNGDQTATTLPDTPPTGFTGTNQHDINTQFAAKIQNFSAKYNFAGQPRMIYVYDRAVILTSDIRAAGITDLRVGKNGATPATIVYPYTIAANDVIEFSATYDFESTSYFTVKGTYND